MNTFILTQLITAFLGTLGFAVLYNLKGAKLLSAAFGGFCAWGIYLFLGIWISNDPLKYFIVAIMGGIYSEFLARIQKTPATTYMVLTLIPLIPGGMLYETMNYALQNSWDTFFNSAIETLKLAGSLALGVITTTSIVRIINALNSFMLSKKR